MIYRIRNKQDWRRLLEMLQTKYKEDVGAWASRNEAGDNSATCTIGDMLENIHEDSNGCLEIDYQELRDTLNSLSWDLEARLEELDGETGQEHEFDKQVVDVCMEHVRPKYPVLVSVLDLIVSGGREPWIEHPIFVLRMQAAASMDDDPDGYAEWRWRQEGHYDVDGFVKRIRQYKWRVARIRQNIPLSGDLPKDAYSIEDAEAVLARIQKDRKCFDKPAHECGNIAVRLDIQWNMFAGHWLADACWMDDNGETFCYSFSQEKEDSGSV